MIKQILVGGAAPQASFMHLLRLFAPRSTTRDWNLSVILDAFQSHVPASTAFYYLKIHSHVRDFLSQVNAPNVVRTFRLDSRTTLLSVWPSCLNYRLVRAFSQTICEHTTYTAISHFSQPIFFRSTYETNMSSCHKMIYKLIRDKSDCIIVICSGESCQFLLTNRI